MVNSSLKFSYRSFYIVSISCYYASLKITIQRKPCYMETLCHTLRDFSALDSVTVIHWFYKLQRMSDGVPPTVGCHKRSPSWCNHLCADERFLRYTYCHSQPCHRVPFVSSWKELRLPLEPRGCDTSAHCCKFRKTLGRRYSTTHTPALSGGHFHEWTLGMFRRPGIPWFLPK